MFEDICVCLLCHQSGTAKVKDCMVPCKPHHQYGRILPLKTRELANDVEMYHGEISVLNTKRKIPSWNCPLTHIKGEFGGHSYCSEVVFVVSLSFKIFGLIVQASPVLWDTNHQSRDWDYLKCTNACGERHAWTGVSPWRMGGQARWGPAGCVEAQQ